MQHKISVFAMLVITQLSMKAQPVTNQNYGSEADYKKLWYLNIQYIQSWVRSDTATYDKLLWAEDFVHQSGANGYLYPKKEIMPIFGQPRFDSIEYFYASDTGIRFITDDAAMVLSRPPYLGKGETKESLTQYNDIYIKRSGRWICVSANITAISERATHLPALKKVPSPTKFVTVMQGSEKDITEITALHRATKEMFEKADPTMAEELLYENFILIKEDGNISIKQQLLTEFKSISGKIPRPYTVENLFIRFVASDIAMVHGAQVFTLTDTEITGIQFNDIYVRRGNGWKLISANNTPIRD